MNEQNKQAYLFLDEGEIVQEGDEFFDEPRNKWRKAHITLGETIAEEDYPYRRPIQPPSIPSDKPTVWDMYAMACIEGFTSVGVRGGMAVGLTKEIADAMMKARPQ